MSNSHLLNIVNINYISATVTNLDEIGFYKVLKCGECEL